MSDEGWMDRRAAEGQREAFREALKKPLKETPPFRGLVEAMTHIGDPFGTFLDIGCGTGGYAVLVDRLWPGLEYVGCDISPYMIDFAKEDYGARFYVCDVMDLDIMRTDIILVSSLIEVCPDWRDVLAHLLVLDFEWLILSRVRVWNDPDRPTHEHWYETIYATQSFEVIHNQSELTALIQEDGGSLTFVYAYQVEDESSLLTMVVKHAD